nr:MAG TPA: hypothetical protein [Caudoviricetes sp.]
MPLNYGNYNNDLSVPRKKDVDAKQDKITGAASTITDDNLTPGKMVVSNIGGKIAVNSNIDPNGLVEYDRYQQVSIPSELYDYQVIGRGFCFRGQYYIPAATTVAGAVFIKTTDGLAYTLATDFIFNYNITDVAVSTLIEAFVVIANNGSIIGTYNSMSNDNIVANTAPTSGKASHTDIYWNNAKSEFVLIGKASSVTGITGMTSAGSFMYTSSDGLTWTLRVQGATGDFNQVRYVNNCYVITDKLINVVYIIDDSYNITSESFSSYNPMFDIIQVGNKLTGLSVVDYDNLYSIIVLSSTDGITWKKYEEEYPAGADAPTRLRNGLIYKNNVQNINASGYSVAGYMFNGTNTFYSLDGEKWDATTDVMGVFYLVARGAAYSCSLDAFHPSLIKITYDLKTTTNSGVVLKNSGGNGIINGAMTGVANAVSADNVTQELGNSPDKIPSERAVKSAIPKITYGTTDLIAGTSPLESGSIYLVYEG